MDRSELPIGVFDSGIGGLSVVKALRERLGAEDYIYLGDTARVPYGTKTKQTVTRFSFQNVEFLLDWSVKLIVVACNTASALALDSLRERYDVPIVGVIEPGVRVAVKRAVHGNIGVIGTEATIRSGCYRTAILRLAPDANVVSRACPLFVPLVEEGWLDDPITYRIAKRYLSVFKERPVDVLILGCTHYPLLSPVIEEVIGPGTLIVDSASSVSVAVEDILRARGLKRSAQTAGSCRFFVTDLPEKVSQIGEMFLGIDDLRIERAQMG